MDLHARLVDLSRLSEPEDTIVTLTLDASKAGLPREARVFLKDKVWKNLASDARSAAAQASLRKTAAKIREYLDKDLAPATDGLYLVAGPSTWTALEVRRPLRNFLHVGRSPYLPPLLELESAAPRAYVVSANGHEASVSEVRLGESRPLARLTAGPGPRDVQRQHAVKGARARSGSGAVATHGGASLDRWQDKMDEEARDTARRAADAVGHYHAVHPAEAVYHFGGRETFRTFADHLPAALRERAVHAGSVPRGDGDVLAHVGRDLERRAEQSARAAVEEFRGRRAQGHRVACGPEEVLASLDAGTLERVYLRRDDPLPGVICSGCGTRTLGLRFRCDWCTGELHPASMAQVLAVRSLSRPRIPVTFVGAGEKWIGEVGGAAALVSARPVRRIR